LKNTDSERDQHTEWRTTSLFRDRDRRRRRR